MRLRLIRHATLQLELAGSRLLVDPMLGGVAEYPSLTVGSSAGRNPTVGLPCPVSDLLDPDAVLLTHSHFDHFDRQAERLLPRDIPVLGQPVDRARLTKLGFDFHGVDAGVGGRDGGHEWRGIQVRRVVGAHGRGLIGAAMGQSSGYVLAAPGEPTVYVAGDTIWCPAVRDAVTTYQPDVIVVNGGAARFNVGGPIVMDADGVVSVCAAAPEALVVAVHMGAINHCRLSRADMHAQLVAAGVAAQVRIPEDGDSLAEPGHGVTP